MIKFDHLVTFFFLIALTTSSPIHINNIISPVLNSFRRRFFPLCSTRPPLTGQRDNSHRDSSVFETFPNRLNLEINHPGLRDDKPPEWNIICVSLRYALSPAAVFVTRILQTSTDRSYRVYIFIYYYYYLFFSLTVVFSSSSSSLFSLLDNI